jgi:hypothetical protein
MVIIAPSMAPKEKKTAITVPMPLMKMLAALGLLLVVGRLFQHLQVELAVRLHAGLEGVELGPARSRVRMEETIDSRRKAVRTVSRPIQISDSFDEPPSSNTPTTLIGRFFLSSKVCSRSRPLNRPPERLADHRLVGAGLGERRW